MNITRQTVLDLVSADHRSENNMAFEVPQRVPTPDRPSKQGSGLPSFPGEASRAKVLAKRKAKEEKAAKVVVISWPSDPGRGEEVYGPFRSVSDAEDWVYACGDAQEQGWELLQGAAFLLTTLAAPFDPSTLWEIGN